MVDAKGPGYTPESLYSEHRTRHRERLIALRSYQVPAETKKSDERTKLPRIVLKNSLGIKLDTFTVLQEAIYRAKWNVKNSKEAVTAEEWRLPNAPLPARPDYSRAAPSLSKSRTVLRPKRDWQTHRSLPGLHYLDTDVDDVGFVAESVNHLPKVPSLSFLHKELWAEPKKYFQIVERMLLHKKILSETDKRDAIYNFPGFCSGCQRSGLCYGCERSSQPHYHIDRVMKTGGGFTYFKKDRPENELYNQNPLNWRLQFPELALRALMEDDNRTSLLNQGDIYANERDGKGRRLPLIPQFSDAFAADGRRGSPSVPDDENDADYLEGRDILNDLDNDKYFNDNQRRRVGQGQEGTDENSKMADGQYEDIDAEMGHRHEGDRSVHVDMEGVSPWDGSERGRRESELGNGDGHTHVTGSDGTSYLGTSKYSTSQESRRTRRTMETDYSHDSGHDSQRNYIRRRDDDDDEGEDEENYEDDDEDEDVSGSPTSSQRRRRLYKAPSPFKLKPKKHRVTQSRSPFSMDRKYNIPKGKPLQIKKGEKSPTQVMEFKRGESSWKEPKKFSVKKSDKEATRFWSPTHKEKEQVQKKRSRPRKANKPHSPDSGLESEKVTGFNSSFRNHNSSRKYVSRLPTVFSPIPPYPNSKAGTGDLLSPLENSGVQLYSRKACQDQDASNRGKMEDNRTVTDDDGSQGDEQSRQQPIIMQSASGAISPIVYEASFQHDWPESELSDIDVDDKRHKHEITVHVPRVEFNYNIDHLTQKISEEGETTDEEMKDFDNKLKVIEFDKLSDNSIDVLPHWPVHRTSLTSNEPDLDLVFDSVIDIKTLQDASHKEKRRSEHGRHRKKLGAEKSQRRIAKFRSSSKNIVQKVEDEREGVLLGVKGQSDEKKKVTAGTDNMENRTDGRSKVKIQIGTEKEHQGINSKEGNGLERSKSDKQVSPEIDCNHDFSYLPSISSQLERICNVKDKNVDEITSEVSRIGLTVITPNIRACSRRWELEENEGYSSDGIEEKLWRSSLTLVGHGAIDKYQSKAASLPNIALGLGLPSLEEKSTTCGQRCTKDSCTCLPKFNSRFRAKKTKVKNPRRVASRSVHQIFDEEEQTMDMSENTDLKNLKEYPTLMSDIETDSSEDEGQTDSIQEVGAKPIEQERVPSPISQGSQSEIAEPDKESLQAPTPSTVVEKPKREKPKKTKKEPTKQSKPSTPAKSITPKSPEPPEPEPELESKTPEPVNDHVPTPTIPELPPLDLPPLPDIMDEKKTTEKRLKLDNRMPIEPMPNIKDALPPPPPKKAKSPKIPKMKPQRRKSPKPAEAPVTTEEIKEMKDPLDFLAKYCIISKDRLPFYDRIFKKVVSGQPPKYERQPPLSPRTGMPLKGVEASWSSHELNMFRDLIVLNRGQDPVKPGINTAEQYLEKICYTLEMLDKKHFTLTENLQEWKNKRTQLLAEKAKERQPEIATLAFKPKAKKSKKKKKKKKNGEVEYVFQPQTAEDITDEVIVSRIDDKLLKSLLKEPELYQIECEMDRCSEKIVNVEDRLMQLEGEKNVFGMYCMEVFFNQQNENQKSISFRRQQSALFNKLHPDPDVEMNLEEVQSALQIINNQLLTEREFAYLFHILNLAGRRKINFKLFAVVAALSEKFIEMDPLIRNMWNRLDYNGLDFKMERSKKLFSLLENGETVPYGNALASSLAVELTAGGLTQEQTRYVLSKFNREGKGFVDFMDYVTYVPLFLEIHERIISEPLKVSISC